MAVAKKSKVAQADKTVEKVLNGFDPASNDQDRRILFDVTGMRLDKDDFSGEVGSDSDDEIAESEKLLPIDFAMMDRFDQGEDEGEDDKQTYALNPWNSYNKTNMENFKFL